MVRVAAMSVVVLLIELYALGFGIHLVRLPVALGLVLAFAWPERPTFQ